MEQPNSPYLQFPLCLLNTDTSKPEAWITTLYDIALHTLLYKGGALHMKDVAAYNSQENEVDIPQNYIDTINSYGRDTATLLASIPDILYGQKAIGLALIGSWSNEEAIALAESYFRIEQLLYFHAASINNSNYSRPVEVRIPTDWFLDAYYTARRGAGLRGNISETDFRIIAAVRSKLGESKITTITQNEIIRRMNGFANKQWFLQNPDKVYINRDYLDDISKGINENKSRAYHRVYAQTKALNGRFFQWCTSGITRYFTNQLNMSDEQWLFAIANYKNSNPKRKNSKRTPVRRIDPTAIEEQRVALLSKAA
jgi:hypothetical protein